MTWLRVFFHRLRGMIFKRRFERDLEDEIRSHLEMQIEENVRQGMTSEEARQAASRKFGGVIQVKEAYRDRLSLHAVETAFQDLRYGLRMLRRNPGFTLVALLTLALGIGANTAIFSVVNAVLLRSLPYREPDQLVLVSYYRTNVGRDFAFGESFLVWRNQARSFDRITAYNFDTAVLTGGGEPERLTVGGVSSDLFATLGVAPSLGRAFTPEEDTAGGAPVVVLSDSLWRRRFGGDPQVIGRALTLDGKSRTVIGIMAPGFRFPEESDLWLPLGLNVAQGFSGQSMTSLSVIARLKPGVTPEAARADLSVILDRQRQSFPKDVEVRVIGLGERLVGNVRLPLLVLFGAVAFVLLIACANVANLLLARSAARQKEMAIRAAVGAGRLRLARQLLTESLLLSLTGGVAGLLLAKWGVKLLVAMSPAGIARIEESRVDGHALGFTCAVAVLTGLIAGAFPALQASKADVNETLKTQSAVSGERAGRGERRALSALMVAELALALVLLIGAGLMTRSFLRLLAVPKGFNPDGVLTLALLPGRANYPGNAQQLGAFFQESLDRVRALPGVQSASMVSSIPLVGPTRVLIGVPIEGRPPYEPGTEPTFDSNFIDPEYFQTMGIPMRAGRPFTLQDSLQDGPEAPQIAIINETLARRFFPNENPIGHRLLIGPKPSAIVGVAGDTRNHDLSLETYPEIYAPRIQPMPGYLVVRVARGQNSPTGLSSLGAAIRNQLRAIGPNEPVSQVVTMDERLSKSVAPRRFLMLLIGIFAGLALVIAAVGIYGVISYAVSQRTQEIGIRMALGAQAGDVLRMVVWRGMRLALVGAALGLAAAFGLTRIMKNLLFEVSATDPVTFALIPLLLVSVALIASYIPARRATMVDPLIALRSE
jgi:putative ABC transport system permease protein